jgi:CheY-like chemotaxis protein/HPt (histidine-containing phosphotransfer) domain-containing protein
VLVMLTSAGIDLDPDERARAGLRRCLTKPVRQSELFDSLVALVGPGMCAAARPDIEAGHDPRFAGRILLAEDNPVNRFLAERRLLTWGHSVVSVEDGETAVRAVQSETFDLILMDVQLPGVDGVAATKRIRALQKDSGRRTPIIAMTAHALKGDRERFLDSGMDDYLPKPVRGALLQAAIERATGRPGRDSHPARLPAGDEARLLAALEGDRALLSEIASLFVADAPRRVGDLRAAIAARDEPAARRANHTLVGAAGNFAAPEAAESLRLLGRLLRSGALRERESSLRLEQALVAAERHVNRLVDQLSLLPPTGSFEEVTCV